MWSGEHCGIELDQPTGHSDGSVTGVRYFRCPTDCALFAASSGVVLERRSIVLPRHRPLPASVP